MTKKEALKLNNKTLDDAMQIQGTDYDRRRKVTKELVYRMKRMHESGKSYGEIANHYGVSYSAVRYNLDPYYKVYKNMMRGKYKNNRTSTPESREERGAYKRSLIESNKKLISK